MSDYPTPYVPVSLLASEIEWRTALIAALRDALARLPDDAAAELSEMHPIIERMVCDAEKGERPRIGRFTV